MTTMTTTPSTPTPGAAATATAAAAAAGAKHPYSSSSSSSYTKPTLVRRRQTLSVLIWIFLSPVALLLFYWCLTTPSLTPFALAYLIFIAFDTAPETGGRKIGLVRRLPLWTWFRDFFPMSLVKTTDLDPSANYIFLYHPHGIISLGAFTNFGTEASHFSRLFPGIDLRLLTLDTNFRLPFFRELLLSLGICSVSRQSCQNVLTKGPGNSIMIVPGGAAEALYAFPGTLDLVLKRRLGFVKLALRHGASLVPVVSFGENDLWQQVPNPKGSTLRTIQETFQRYASFSPPLLFGRGIFSPFSMGFIPFRTPVVSVVGKPIPCPRVPNPSDEEVRKIHQQYMDAVKALFEEHQDKYGKKVTNGIRFVE
ncbi:diacylglycerol acyltransferase-domain-containing protein [Zopfochytrium polystomum]|nr:diacylglycerol acyltransferase-domain-containing protein [Zopfochytrium polystomum]